MSRTAKAIRVGNLIWAHHSGRTFCVEAQRLASKSVNPNSEVVESDGKLRSPMPGKILKINSTNGQKVKRGDTVLVIEAMKMEYAQKAPFDGTIHKLEKKVGDQVLLDEIVAEISK